MNITDGSNTWTKTTAALTEDQHFTLDAFGISMFQYIDYGGWDCGELYLDNVTYVPEPATVAILGFGSLVMLRRRR